MGKFCKNCGNQLDEGAKFCRTCGEPVFENDSAEQQNAYNAEQGNQQYDQQYQNQQYNQQQYAQPGSVFAPVTFGQRSIILSIILSIITCGIYGLYWIYKLVEELNEASGNTNDTGGLAVILFSLITCGIYGLYWYYKAGEKVNTAKTQRGIGPADSSFSILYLVLGIFGLGIISYALIQNELNKISAFYGHPAA